MVTAILLSGGTGQRLGSEIPKQYIEVKGKPIIYYALKVLIESKRIDFIQIVAVEEWRDYIKAQLEILCIENSRFAFSNPGDNRQLSIYNALCDIKGNTQKDDLVLIHDAARPLLMDKLIKEMLDTITDRDKNIVHDGVMPVLSMKDTVYMTDEAGRLTGLLERNLVKAGQAPELFVFGKYIKACEDIIQGKYDIGIMNINGSSEPALLAGLDVVTIPGDERNFKITTREDMKRFEESIP